MKKELELKAGECRRRSRLKSLPAAGKKGSFLGQERAREAFEFGLEVRDTCYNVFVAGPYGTGRQTYIADALNRHAAALPDGSDLLYLRDFDDENRAIALELPAGRGAEFGDRIEEALEAIRRGVAELFDKEEVEAKSNWEISAFQRWTATVLTRFNEEVRKRSFVPKGDGMEGFFIVPSRTEKNADGEETVHELTVEEFEALSEEEKEKYHDARQVLQAARMDALKLIKTKEREVKDGLMAIEQNLCQKVIKAQARKLRRSYAKYPKAAEWLDRLRETWLDNFTDFLPQPPLQEGEDPFENYRVNLVARAEKGAGAPVIFEHHPTYYNVGGKVEYEMRQGYYSTDFTHIVAGSLHRARDGFLVIDAEELLKDGFAYDLLKRTLRSGQVVIESLGEQFGSTSVVAPRPEPVPFKGRVVLYGSPRLYYLLKAYDPEFSKLFKLAVEFDDEMDRQAGERDFGALILRLSRERGFLPLALSGLNEVLDAAVRFADDSGKLTLRIGRVMQLVSETDAFARGKKARAIERDHVVAALELRRRRAGLWEDRTKEEFKNGVVRIETTGSQVGQINGLSVVSFGDTSFGHPSRLTANTSMGKGGIVHLERETDQAGPIHNKGLLTLTSYFDHLYAQHYPLSFSATLSFEQLYGGIEGDSASCAELYCLLSSLADVPLRQDLAVTGSVDQKGHVQAIGGVNEKIEGFFDYCAERGLTGTQGVLIPRSNVRHLMVAHRVEEAVKAGQFHIYALSTVDEGIELLTGLKAGEPDGEGNFPEDSLHGKVQKKLQYWSVDAPIKLAKKLEAAKKQADKADKASKRKSGPAKKKKPAKGQ